jgi:hypothetical protein
MKTLEDFQQQRGEFSLQSEGMGCSVYYEDDDNGFDYNDDDNLDEYADEIQYNDDSEFFDEYRTSYSSVFNSNSVIAMITITTK